MLKERMINSKKIRNQIFYNTLFIIAIVAFLIILCVAVLPSDYILIVQIMAPMVLILLLSILFQFRKVLCILSSDRLYYFLPKDYGVEFTVVFGKRRKVSSQDGWILYSDIQRYEYLPRTHYLPTRVILYGTDFELKISGVGKRFVKKLKEQQKFCAINYNVKTDSIDALVPKTTQTVRNGLWKDIWESFENGVLEDMLRNYEIIWLEYNEIVDVINILVKNFDHEIDFNLDSCSIYMYASDNDTDKTVYYEQVADMKTLFSVMHDFINCNS